MKSVLKTDCNFCFLFWKLLTILSHSILYIYIYIYTARETQLFATKLWVSCWFCTTVCYTFPFDFRDRPQSLTTRENWKSTGTRAFHKLLGNFFSNSSYFHRWPRLEIHKHRRASAFPVKNGAPFTYLITVSLLEILCLYVFFDKLKYKMTRSPLTRCVISFIKGPSEIPHPFHVLQLGKSQPFHKPEPWKRYPFWAELPRIAYRPS